MPSAEQITAAYERTLQETVTIRRYTGVGTARAAAAVTARGRAMQTGASVLIGNISLSEWTVFVLAKDIDESSIGLPLLKTDKPVTPGGKELTIVTPKERRALDGTLIAYELQCGG
jgi:hypothetical protein